MPAAQSGIQPYEVIRDGFQTTKDVRLIGMDQHYQPRIVLQPVGNTTVEIVASAASAIDPTDVKTSKNYDARKVDQLPMGRTPDAMAQFSPGVTTGVGGRTQVRGAMTSGNLYLLDGQNVLDNAYHTMGMQLINDSFEETQVMSGAISAEYGSVDGGVINTVTKSGSNDFHGQIRFNMSNPSWNAYRPMQPRNANDNVMSEERNYQLGGYFIKDRLWFHVTVLQQDSSSVGSVGGRAPAQGGHAGDSFLLKTDRTYTVYKLNYRVNDDHAVVLSYSDNKTTSDRAYGAASLDALEEQIDQSHYYNVSLRSVWSPNFTSEIRFGAKHMDLTAHPKHYPGPNDSDLTHSPISVSGGRVNNGIFANEPQNRDNFTFNLKGSFFTNWNGSHEIDFGMDYYKGERSNANRQSVTDYMFYPNDYDARRPDGRIYRAWDMDSYPDFTDPDGFDESSWVAWWFPTGPAVSASQTEIGFYVNDKWKLDNHWAFQIGLRYDSYSCASEDAIAPSPKASGISPRLGVSYDLFGDQQWIFKASYCLYNGAVLEGITGAISGAGSIGTSQTGWLPKPGVNMDADGWTTLEELTKLSNYDWDNPGAYYSNPILNLKVDTGMKAPTTAEMQLGASYSFDTEKYGRGYARLTLVKKDFKNLMDYVIGADGYVLQYPDQDIHDPDSSKVYVRRWTNVDQAKREYQSMELDVDYTYNALHFNGNVTWSSLRGNYTGEATNSPGTGEGLTSYWYHYVTEFNGYGEPNPAALVGTLVGPNFDINEVRPVGNLYGDKPIVIHGMLDYVMENSMGRTALGLVYRFESGNVYSQTRGVGIRHYSEYLYGNPSLDQGVPEAGSTITQYDEAGRGGYRLPSTAYHDLAITHDFNLFKVGGTQVTAFVKLLIYNFLNHQQIGMGSYTNAAGGSTVTTFQGVTSANALGKDAPWVPNVRGAITANSYGDARSISVSAGIRF